LAQCCDLRFRQVCSVDLPWGLDMVRVIAEFQQRGL
jgi:hypothetical protein